MLTNKRINIGISVISRVLRIVIILYSASILANCVWWILSPADTNVFIQWADLDNRDKITSYINNRYPFGVIVVAKPKEKAQEQRPRVADQLKLTGVYLNTAHDSFAFLEYQGKPIVARVGAEIGNSGAIVKSINVDSIVISADDQDATIKVTTGGVTQASSVPPSSGSNNVNPDTMFGNRSGNNVQNNDNNSSSNQAIEDARQQRMRFLEEYRSRLSSNQNQARESSSNDE